jgi:1-pyrroline-5-carboxylate dehydrogenase
MGGKDAIIVDADTDLDAAATGVVQSAFGFQGQKCSACSRAIVHTDVYDSMLEKNCRAHGKLRVGDPTEAATGMSAVINQKAFKTINEYIEKAKPKAGACSRAAAQTVSKASLSSRR